MSKRSAPGEADGNDGAERDAEGFLPSAMKEVLALLKVIDKRLEERKKPPPAGSTRAAFAKLAKAVGAIGEDVGETRKQVGKLVEKEPDHNKAVEAAAGLAETLGGYRGDFGRWVEADRRRRRYWRMAVLATATRSLGRPPNGRPGRLISKRRSWCSDVRTTCRREPGGRVRGARSTSTAISPPSTWVLGRIVLR